MHELLPGGMRVTIMGEPGGLSIMCERQLRSSCQPGQALRVLHELLCCAMDIHCEQGIR